MDTLSGGATLSFCLPLRKGYSCRKNLFFHLSFLYKEIAKTLCGTLTLQTSFVINMYAYSLLSKKNPHVSRKNLLRLNHALLMYMNGMRCSFNGPIINDLIYDIKCKYLNAGAGFTECMCLT